MTKYFFYQSAFLSLFVVEAYECDAATKQKIEIPSVKSQNSFVQNSVDEDRTNSVVSNAPHFLEIFGAFSCMGYEHSFILATQR